MNRARLALFAVLLAIAGCSSTPEQDPREATGAEFRDCETCPLMVTIPEGSFLMGTADGAGLIDPRTGKPAVNDRPQHQVNVSKSIAIGKYEVTTGEYSEFVAATGYRPDGGCMEFSEPESFAISTEIDWGNSGFPQTSDQPVGCVSYFDAEAYAAWLSRLTGENYRLPTETEWEYAARAGATTAYHWGDDDWMSCMYANVRSQGADTISKRQAQSDIEDGFPCDDKFAQSSPAGSFKPNDFKLHDMQGNNWEWVQDCNHKDYKGAPADGSAWLDDKPCTFGVIRGGSFLNRVERSSVTVRAGRPRSGRGTNMGFRIARDHLAESATVAATGTGTAFGSTENIDISSPGARLFADNCAACHESSDNLAGLYGTDQESLVNAITYGGNNIMSMPAFGDRLTSSEIESLASYLRDVNGW